MTLRDSIQVILKWVGGGTKLNLSKTPNADRDILKAIVLKLQKRVEAGAGTLLVKVNLLRTVRTTGAKCCSGGKTRHHGVSRSTDKEQPTDMNDIIALHTTSYNTSYLPLPVLTASKSVTHRAAAHVSLTVPIVLNVPDMWIRDEDNLLIQTIANTIPLNDYNPIRILSGVRLQ